MHGTIRKNENDADGKNSKKKNQRAAPLCIKGQCRFEITDLSRFLSVDSVCIYPLCTYMYFCISIIIMIRVQEAICFSGRLKLAMSFVRSERPYSLVAHSVRGKGAFCENSCSQTLPQVFGKIIQSVGDLIGQYVRCVLNLITNNERRAISICKTGRGSFILIGLFGSVRTGEFQIRNRPGIHS